MPTVDVRPAVSADLPLLQRFEPDYTTDFVWQMDARREDGQVSLAFRRVRLPRPMRVEFPRPSRLLVDEWPRQACMLVAEIDGVPRGYLRVSHAPAPATGWIADFVVERRVRRQGIGSALWLAARSWASTNGLRRMLFETQSKNYPAIAFCEKHGLSFCGYNDRYYLNQDIALFFGVTLR